MHMADALLSPAVAATMYVASGTTAGISIKRLTGDENTQKLPTMAVASALVFAGQMINYTIPGTGSSGHMCGGMLLSALLGPEAGFLSMIVVLTIQCLFFADGGLMALGANIWNMAFYGCFVGYYLIWRPIMRSRLFENLGPHAAQRAVLETTLSGITELPFGAFCALMQPIHLAIGLVEGLITTAVLTYVYETRPELVRDVDLSEEAAAGKSSKSLGTVIVTLALAALIVGGVFSHFASSNPDGLEWALFGNEEAGYSANMGLDEDNFGTSSAASETASSIQEKTSFLPDYGFAGSENPMGTTISGIAGSIMVAAAALAICFVGRFFRRKNA